MASLIRCIVALVLLQACASPERREVPENPAELGSIAGTKEFRVWGDRALPDLESAAKAMRLQISAGSPDALHQPQAFLVLSGGGQNGAFGAGLLNGWSQRGDRPEFRIVTGISAGAIIAPFAFLGAGYDDRLEKMYTSHNTKDVVRKRPLRGMFGGDALADSTPLLTNIQRYLDEQAIDNIAVEHEKGRRLYIGTTYLDARRPVIWDVGAIAASDYEYRADLIYRIIMASTAIPGAFPPVYFDARQGDTNYNKMHVDGGIGNQLFISPTSFSIREVMQRVGFSDAGTIYVIRNGLSEPAWALVKPSALAISSASLLALTFNQGNTDQYAVFLQARLDGVGYRAARIPGHFEAKASEAFDRDYMRQLFDLAFRMAAAGYPWETEPNRSSH